MLLSKPVVDTLLVSTLRGGDADVKEKGGEGEESWEKEDCLE